jgi:hypothetical protein
LPYRRRRVDESKCDCDSGSLRAGPLPIPRQLAPLFEQLFGLRQLLDMPGSVLAGDELAAARAQLPDIGQALLQAVKLQTDLRFHGVF